LADVAKNKILQFLPNANTGFINKKGQDILISVVDQPRESIIDWVNEACIKEKIPLICGALDWKWALYYSIIPGKTGCIECWKINAKKSNLLFHELIREKEFLKAASPNVAIAPLIAILTGLILTDLLKIITGIEEPKSLGKLQAFDFHTTTISTLESWDVNPNCVICQNSI